MPPPKYAVEYEDELVGPFDTYDEARAWSKKAWPQSWSRAIIAELHRPWETG